ncbi:hypothetical protein [Rickettsia japonica]|uniref:Uncharacterized protein n=1 Tax=Rickettsia japonica TaxID=35790 RepID=A0AAD1CBY7_RICJA|nr:hypothetical protein [Rickettsia japonica]BAW83369.1 predicted protein [Rickettsia japonica]
MLEEQQTEWIECIISNNLVNKVWHIDNDTKKNVYFQKPKSKIEQTRLNGKRPDYILYEDIKGDGIFLRKNYINGKMI